MYLALKMFISDFFFFKKLGPESSVFTYTKLSDPVFEGFEAGFLNGSNPDPGLPKCHFRHWFDQTDKMFLKSTFVFTI